MGKSFLFNRQCSHHFYCLSRSVDRVRFCSKLCPELLVARRKSGQDITVKVYLQNLALAFYSIWDIHVLNSSANKNMS